MSDLPEELKKWMEAGGEVRSGESAFLPGRCGGSLARTRSKVDGPSHGMPYCGRTAGWGTDHPRIGRCGHHEDDYVDGLPPLGGDLPVEVWEKSGPFGRAHG